MRKFILSAGVVLFVLAVSCLYVGVSELSDIRPASDYDCLLYTSVGKRRRDLRVELSQRGHVFPLSVL